MSLQISQSPTLTHTQTPYFLQSLTGWGQCPLAARDGPPPPPSSVAVAMVTLRHSLLGTHSPFFRERKEEETEREKEEKRLSKWTAPVLSFIYDDKDKEESSKVAAGHSNSHQGHRFYHEPESNKQHRSPHKRKSVEDDYQAHAQRQCVLGSIKMQE